MRSDITGKDVVKAMLPGTILDVLVQKGDRVAKGDTLCILEAMKMENEILSPVAGVVDSIFISKGELVAKGTVMFKIE
jgi:biotin carboxyl carrier protein